MARKKNNDTNDLSFLKDKLDEIKETLALARTALIEAKDSKDKPVHNVRFVTPHVFVEYEEFKTDKERTVIDLLNKYEMWAHEICASIFANKGNLKNNALRTHLASALLTCESLDYSFRSIFEEKKE